MVEEGNGIVMVLLLELVVKMVNVEVKMVVEWGYNFAAAGSDYGDGGDVRQNYCGYGSGRGRWWRLGMQMVMEIMVYWMVVIVVLMVVVMLREDYE